jgi:hypothetical protein
MNCLKPGPGWLAWITRCKLKDKCVDSGQVAGQRNPGHTRHVKNLPMEGLQGIGEENIQMFESYVESTLTNVCD